MAAAGPDPIVAGVEQLLRDFIVMQQQYQFSDLRPQEMSINVNPYLQHADQLINDIRATRIDVNTLRVQSISVLSEMTRHFQGIEMIFAKDKTTLETIKHKLDVVKTKAKEVIKSMVVAGADLDLAYDKDKPSNRAMLKMNNPELLHELEEVERARPRRGGPKA